MSYKQIIIFIMITLLASCNNDNRIANEIKRIVTSQDIIL